MSDIIIFILSFYFCLISVLAYGNFFQRIFLEKNINKNIDVYTGFYGLMFLTLISLITSYFVQHNYYHNFILHGLGFVYFFFTNFKNNKKFYKNIFYISIFLFSILLISKTHDDFSYYHLPFTKFLTESQIIFGMGHLNLGYNFLSSLFFLNSTFYLPLIELYSFHFSIIFFLIFFNYFLLKNIFSNKTHEFFKFFYFITFVFFNVSFNRLAEFGMDKPGQLLIVILIIKLFEIIIITKQEKKLNEILLLLPLFGLCISIKTYFLTYILLSFSIVLLNKKILENLKFIIFSKSFFFFLLILVSMFFHHFISTGCIISPLPYLCFENLSWARSIDDVKELSIWLEQWSKAGANPNFRVEDELNYIKDFNWVPNWFEKYFLIKFLDQIGILIFSIILPLLFFKRFFISNNKIFFKKEFFIFYSLIVAIFYIWLTHHPTLRYGGYSIFFLLIAFPVSYIFYSTKSKKNNLKKFKFLTIFVIIIVNLKNYDRINNEFERSDLYSFKNFPFFAIDKKKFNKKEYETGLILYSAHHCWATPSPCGNISDFNNFIVYQQKGYNFIKRQE